VDEHKDLNRRQFGAHAQDYVSSADHAQGLSLARLVELVSPRSEWIVLDVSTGGGHTAVAFSPQVLRVVATDLAPEMLAAAEKSMNDRGIWNVEFRTADAESLPFGDGEFDLVTNRVALHHYQDARKAISEMARVLKPGGALGLVDNVVPPDKQTAGYINGFEKLHDPSHHWCYPLIRLQAYLADAGLTVEHSETTKKERDLDTWADRSGCTELTKERLRALLREAPEGPRLFLNPHNDGKRFMFSLEEAILIGRK
jgi:ubiquinone/menaquinone biosynthesis C-methylase UbiE